MSVWNKITGLARYLKLLPQASIPLSSDPGIYTDAFNELHYSDGTNDIQLTENGELIGPGLAVYADSLGSDFTVTTAWSDVAGGNLAQVNAVEVSFVLTKLSDITLNYVGTADVDTGSDLILGYQIDADTPVPCFYEQGGGGGMRTINMSVTVEGLAPGSYTIKLMAASSGGVDPIIKGTSNYNIAKFTASVVAGGSSSSLNRILIEREPLAAGVLINTSWANVAGGNMAQIGAWQATIEVPYECNIELEANVPIYFNTGVSEFIGGYQVNSETPIPVVYENHPIVQVQGRTCIIRDTLINRPPGTYTIKVMASRNLANPFVLGPSNNAYPVLTVKAIPVDGVGGGSAQIIRRRGVAVASQTNQEVILGVTDTSAPRTITLRTADLIEGRLFIIKDESGGASGNTITIATEGAELIDGAATTPINTDYGVVRLYSDGVNWFSF